MKHNIYTILLIVVTMCITSCDKDDNIAPNTPGCTDSSATNYNPLATIDDGSCIYVISGCTNPDALNYNSEAVEDDGSCIILGCTDENATNYNPDATDDNGSCEYSNSSILNGLWNIISLEYSTEIDLSDIPTIGPLLGVQDISGEAINAGTWAFSYPEYLYSNNLNFTTEPITIATFDVPGFPIDVSSDGSWILTNNDNVLVITDFNTGTESFYEIISITNTNAIISGIVPFSQEVMGMAFDLDIEMEMILEKQ